MQILTRPKKNVCNYVVERMRQVSHKQRDFRLYSAHDIGW